MDRLRICGLLPPLRIAWQVFVRPSFPYPSFSWFCRASTKRFGFRWIDLGGVDRRTGSGGFALVRLCFLRRRDSRCDLSCQMRPDIIEAPPPCAGSCGCFSNPVRIRRRSVVVLLSSYRDAAIVALRRRCPAALPSSRSAAVVLPRRRHRFVAAPMTPTMFLVTAFRQIVRVDNARHPGYSLCNLSIACQNAWFFPSLPECFRLFSSSSHSPLLSVRYLGRTTEKMIRRCLVREKALKPCSSGRGRLVGSPGERRSFSIENRRKGARKPQKEGDTICKTGKRQRRGTDHPQNAERMRRVFFGPFL